MASQTELFEGCGDRLHLPARHTPAESTPVDRWLTIENVGGFTQLGTEHVWESTGWVSATCGVGVQAGSGIPLLLAHRLAVAILAGSPEWSINRKLRRST